MKSVLAALRPLRFLLSVCICAFLLFSYALPTFDAAAVPLKDEPAKNEPNPSANKAVKEYEQVARDALHTPGGPGPNLEETQARTQEGGLNEVQGRAGLEEMKRPSNSGGVPTVEKSIKNALEKVQDK
ncbi:hypothetical protein H6F43_13175 [Leptolyngbya sp. FACHB-36]|uniref:hypothetical protein n=1 Tax=Leptolyngbya sp. FACHB-36 TaxID=2692808 RepID=UPI00168129F6|nr:hypothetical protein [Leptolyngbya sp. FACHB-36]MBD2021131.1 hypothetical protein [Leptolyngbya sp. FACHB-36]